MLHLNIYCHISKPTSIFASPLIRDIVLFHKRFREHVILHLIKTYNSVGCSCRTCSPYNMFSFDPWSSTTLQTVVSTSANILSAQQCSCHRTKGQLPFLTKQTMRNLSLEQQQPQNIEYLFYSQEGNITTISIHTLHGQVHISRVFSIMYLALLKRHAEVCWATLLKWVDEIMRSNSECCVQITSRHRACLFSWNNPLRHICSMFFFNVFYLVECPHPFGTTAKTVNIYIVGKWPEYHSIVLVWKADRV